MRLNNSLLMAKSTNDDDDDGWIILIVILFVAFLFWLASKKDSKTRKPADDESESIKNEIKRLEVQSHIADKHQKIYNDINSYLEQKSNRYYKLIIRYLIVIFIALNLTVYFLVPSIEVFDLFGINSAVVVVMAIVEFFVWFKITSVRNIINKAVKSYLDYTIFGTRGRSYYHEKIEENKKLKSGIEQRKDELQRKLDSSQ